uniref:synaptic vesicle 2-related protein-like n=1 Tax=Myxine glutinosa TaxID=7769 RepID=UPI00358EC742
MSLCHDVKNEEGLLRKRTEIAVTSNDRTPCCKKDTRVFTLDDAIETLGFGKFQWLVFAIGGFSWFSIAILVLSPTILGPKIQCEWDLHSWQVALIYSMHFTGQALFSPLWGNFADKYGRKLCILFSTMCAFYFGILSSFAPSYNWFLFLWFLVGISEGGLPHVATLYTEFLTVKMRSRCIINLSVTWSFGILVMVGLGVLLLPIMTWKWFLFLSCLPLIVSVLICFSLPESVYYNMVCGQNEKALATLERISRYNGVPLPAGTLMTSTKQERLGRIQDLLCEKQRRTTLLLCFIWLVNSFSYYGMVLLTTELMKVDNSCAVPDNVDTEDSNCIRPCQFLTTKDYLNILWTTLAELPGLFIASFTTEYLGRKPTIAFGMLFLCGSLFCLMACLERTMITVLLFIGRAMVSGTFMGLYVYTPEVYPTAVRAMSFGTCVAFSRLGTILTPFVAQVASTRTAEAVYASLSFLACIAVLLLPFETKGQRLKDSRMQDSHGLEMVMDSEKRPENCTPLVTQKVEFQSSKDMLSLNSGIAAEQECSS